MFSFESKVSDTERKEEGGEVGEVGEVGVGSRDSRISRMRELKCAFTSARLVNQDVSNINTIRIELERGSFNRKDGNIEKKRKSVNCCKCSSFCSRKKQNRT